jgi:acyl-CoA synthetase (AMP-forming)/AMP-acid ligase II
VPHRKLTATALVTRNSLSYIENVFALNEARQPFVNVPDESSVEVLTGIDIERCIIPDERTGWFSEGHPLIRDDRPAQVTYTSGTEGNPKGIVLTYSNLADAAERIISEMGLTSNVRELPTVSASVVYAQSARWVVVAICRHADLIPLSFLECSSLVRSMRFQRYLPC